MPRNAETDSSRKSAAQPFADYFEALLKTPPFQTSSRRNALLRYLVHKSLAGQGANLSEYAIALEVFQKPETFDQRIDSSVRSEISRLRKFVAKYYQGSGAHDPWQIVFPARGYVPEILRIEQDGPVAATVPSRWRLHRVSTALLSTGTATVIAIVAAVFLWGHFGSKSSAQPAGEAVETPAHRSHTPNPDAEALYLKGQYYRDHRSDDSLHKAVDAYTQAIVADSEYAEAYAALAATYDLMPEYSSMSQEEAFGLAIATAKKALSINPSISIAHRSLAFGLFWSQTDIPQSIREFQEAIRLSPNDSEAHHWYATALIAMHRTAEAHREIDIAQQLSPASRSILADQAWIRYLGGDPQGIARLQELEKSEPDFKSPPDYLARIDLAQENYLGYLEQLHRLAAISTSPADLKLSKAAQKGWDSNGRTGMLRAIKATQEQVFAQNQSDGYDLAHTCALLGERQEAVKYLKIALASKNFFVIDTLRPDWAPLLNGYPPFEVLRTNIRRRFGIAQG